MAARLYPDVFGVLRTDLAELEGGAHLAVELVLLLGHPHVILRCGLDRPGEIRVNTAAVRIQITATHTSLLELTAGRLLQSFSGAV